ncbi:hypothetical protein TNCV_5086971 [Trichonephila clavipes]|nr:hypothetical protein TNCV_5086971 [Trichonephila clavipes]
MTAQLTVLIQVCFLKGYCEQHQLAPNEDVSDHGLHANLNPLVFPLPPLKVSPNDPGKPYIKDGEPMAPDNARSVAISQRANSPLLIEDETLNDYGNIDNLIAM